LLKNNGPTRWWNTEPGLTKPIVRRSIMAYALRNISARMLATSLAASALLFGLSMCSAPATAVNTASTALIAADIFDVNPFTLPRAEACVLAEVAPTDSNLEACFGDPV
jgi:hypothetical protein